MSAGHDIAEHTEVSPGVFILTSIHEAGDIRYTPAEGELAMGPEIEPVFGPGGASYCYEYETRSYSDSTSQGTLFGGDTSWYGSASAYSYEGFSGTTNSVYMTVNTSTPTYSNVDYIYAYGYVYVNDRYVGYLTDYQENDNQAYISGNWDLPCLDGEMNFQVFSSHYVSDSASSGGLGTISSRQGLSISNTLEASVECCP